MGTLTCNGIDLSEYGLYVSGDKAFSSPEKEYEKISIPGRSGDLILYNGRYSNVDLAYDCILLPAPMISLGESMEERFRNNAASIREILLSPEGYVKIQDDYNPDEYRLGVFTGPLDIDAVFLKAGKATLEFYVRPERYLTDVLILYNTMRFSNPVSTYTITDNFTNPTAFDSKPVITFLCESSFTWRFQFYKDSVSADNLFSDFTITNTDTARRFKIDSESLNVSVRLSSDDEWGNGNSYITFNNDTDFPALPGSKTTYLVYTVTSPTESITNTRVYTMDPRWYRL